MKLLWVTNIPSPYRVDFFNELGKFSELTVLFERSSSKEREENWAKTHFHNFTGIIMNGVKVGVDQALSPKVLTFISKRKYDHIIIANPLTPTGIIAILYLKLLKIKYYIESDGGFIKSGKGTKEYIKKLILKDAGAYFSTSKTHDDYYLFYGAMANRVYRYPFTSLKKQDILNNPLEIFNKNQIKQQLGINETKVILAVGRFIPLKGFETLLRAAQNIDSNVGIYIIGGKATPTYLSLVESLNINNVHFIEFQKEEKLKEYYKASDIFVLPTKSDVWGLVINDAMSTALPVITTSKCMAGLHLIKNGENGFIINPDDHITMSEKINRLLNDDALRSEIGKKNLSKIKEYTIENMAQTYLKTFQKIVSK